MHVRERVELKCQDYEQPQDASAVTPDWAYTPARSTRTGVKHVRLGPSGTSAE